MKSRRKPTMPPKPIYVPSSLLTKDQIEEINRLCSKMEASQGIYDQPSGIPVALKGPMIYSRWESGGSSGGSYDGSVSKPYSNAEPKDHMRVLDLVLERVCPNISFIQHRALLAMVERSDVDSGSSDYYGNYANYVTEYLPLATLEQFLRERGLLA